MVDLKLPFNSTSVVRLGVQSSAVPYKDQSPNLGKRTMLNTIDSKGEEPEEVQDVARNESQSSVLPSEEPTEVEDMKALEPDTSVPDTGLQETNNVTTAADDDSDSSTPRQVDGEEDDEENSVAQLPDEDEQANNGDADKGRGSGLTTALDSMADDRSQISHSYYNTPKKKKDNAVTYYNDSAAEATVNEQKIEIDPNDYESMYSIKRDLDMLRESASEVTDKIDSLGSKKNKSGKNI